MTKLTIQHEGKSYGVTDESHFMVLAVVNSLIDKLNNKIIPASELSK